MSTSATRSSSSSCLHRSISVLGWSFDVFLILVNITDVVSDGLIAHQFWKDGHRTFFGLVMASLVLSSLIYTFVGVEFMLRERMRSRWQFAQWPRVLQYPIVLLISQLIPVLNWVLDFYVPLPPAEEVAQWSRLTTSLGAPLDDGGSTHVGVAGSTDETSSGQTAAAAHAATSDAALFKTGIMKEHITSMEQSSIVLSRLDAALARHLRSHVMFYVESVVEAIPQTVVQLLAVSFLGTATPIQVFSLALSMLSIMSKGYVLSRSFSVPMMAFKFLICCHDLFAAFYIFATLVSNKSSPDFWLSSDIAVDWMSFAWLCSQGVFWGLACLVAIVIGIRLLTLENVSALGCKELQRGLIVVLIGSLLVVPSVVVIECCTLGWLILWCTLMEPTPTAFPKLSLWYSFCTRANDSEEFVERFRYMFIRYLQMSYAAVVVDPPTRRVNPSRFQLHGPVIRNTFCIPPEPRFPRGIELVNVSPVAQDIMKILSPDSSDPREQQCPKSLCALALRCVSLVRLPDISSNSNGAEATVALATLAIIVAIYFIGQMYSVLFPFVHFAVASYDHQNLLQLYCFFGTAVTTLILLCLLPIVLPYFVFVFIVGRVMPTGCTGTLEAFERCVEEYYLPSTSHFIGYAVDPILLPHDLLEVVASFLLPRDLDLSKISVDDCNAVHLWHNQQHHQSLEAAVDEEEPQINL